VCGIAILFVIAVVNIQKRKASAE